MNTGWARIENKGVIRIGTRRIITQATTIHRMRRTSKPRSSARPRAAEEKLSGCEAASQPAAPPPPWSTTRFLPWAIVLLVILLAAMVRIRLLETPLERDEGEYAYNGQLLLQCLASMARSP
jgi:hypothetical protein